MRQKTIDLEEPGWEFIPPMKKGLPFWSKTKNFSLWNEYVTQRGCVKVIDSAGLVAQDPKTGAAIGGFNHKGYTGVIYHDVREDGLNIVNVKTATGLDFT